MYLTRFLMFICLIVMVTFGNAMDGTNVMNYPFKKRAKIKEQALKSKNNKLNDLLNLLAQELSIPNNNSDEMWKLCVQQYEETLQAKRDH